MTSSAFATIGVLLAEIAALAVPPHCTACRAPGRRAGDVLCGACRRALPWLARPCCERCALPLPHRAACPANDAPFHAAWSAVAYEGAARDAMHALKFSAARPLAAVMAAQIAANVPAAMLEPAGGAPDAARERSAPSAFRASLLPEPAAAPVRAIVAVPAHPVRRRARGFDPAELLARALARTTGLALARPLRRSTASRRQLGADRATRRDAARLGFEAHGPAPRTAILVDDVHTTGATLCACAAVLRDCGAERIVALTWARAL